MQVKVTLTKQAEDKARSMRLLTRLNQKLGFFRADTRHRSLHFELLEPKHLGFYSIRINDQYRAKLIKIKSDEYSVIDVLDYH